MGECNVDCIGWNYGNEGNVRQRGRKDYAILRLERMVFISFVTNADFQALFNLVTCSNYSIVNYDRISFFHYFENVNKGHLKMLKVKYEIWPDFAILSF